MLAVTIYAHIPFGQSTRYTVEEKAWPVTCKLESIVKPVSLFNFHSVIPIPVVYPMFAEKVPEKFQCLFKEQLYNCPTDTLWLLNYQSDHYNYPQATEAQTKVIREVKNG